MTTLTPQRSSPAKALSSLPQKERDPWPTGMDRVEKGVGSSFRGC